ncbi:hypothetical protein S23_58540 [Bradyrhizobium cosmicum]|uniref:Uncharacterized protein n=1 Tax=Bradyrhizobium cosmicum TaxID=1404864 RepID=A0AAI8QF24_9BRAD|nr:hypothetical protein S23_58540 [Bradyrhizobium cosmicum]
MPGTRSSAATKCISEVPGLEKQMSTPPLTIVRTRLSAPFIPKLLQPAISNDPSDQSLFARAVKAIGGIAALPRAAMHRFG